MRKDVQVRGVPRPKPRGDLAKILGVVGVRIRLRLRLKNGIDLLRSLFLRVREYRLRDNRVKDQALVELIAEKRGLTKNSARMWLRRRQEKGLSEGEIYDSLEINLRISGSEKA